MDVSKMNAWLHEVVDVPKQCTNRISTGLREKAAKMHTV